MTIIDFETYLGKDINEIFFIGNMPEAETSGIYSILKPNVKFIGKEIDQVVITTIENKTIESITIFFLDKIDKAFYNIISDVYGCTKDIMVFDKILYDGPVEELNNESSFPVTVQEKIVSLKKGSIEDNRVNFIVWKKDDYQLTLNFDYPNNRMFVQFIKKKS